MSKVTLHTTSDADFRRTFAAVQRFPAWDASTFYSIGAKVEHSGNAWNAPAAGVGIEPGTNPTYWAVTARVPLDLTGCGLRLQARRTAGDAGVLLDLAIGSGITIEGSPTGGRFTLWITHALLAAMAPANYVFALIRLLADGSQERVFWGTIAHDQGVFR